MTKIDPVDAMLMQKHAARITMSKALKLSKSKAERARLKGWIEKGDEEIAALISIQKQLAGLRAVKRAAASV